MARVPVVPKLPVNTGLNITTFTAFIVGATNGITFPNTTPGTFVIVKTTGDTTFSIIKNITLDGDAAAAKTIAVTGTKEYILGPFSPAIYNDSSGNVQIDIDGAGAASYNVIMGM
jgi:hypothetical protein